MSDGIGSYYSPSPLRPINPREAAVLHHTSGLGSYYSPSPLRPINPPESTPAFHTSGLGDTGVSGPTTVGALLFLGILGAVFMGAK